MRALWHRFESIRTIKRNLPNELKAISTAELENVSRDRKNVDTNVLQAMVEYSEGD